MSRSYYKKYKDPVRVGLLITLFALTGFLLLRYFIPVVDQNQGTARVELQVGEQKRAFEGEIIPGMTVLEALQAAAMAGDISFKYTFAENGEKVVIEVIDGYKPEVQTLVLRLNSQPLNTNKIHSTPIRNGDVIIISTR